MTDFETNNFVKVSSTILGVFNLSYYFGHFLIINKLNKQNISIDDVSCFGIILKILSSTLFFLLLNKYHIQNTESLKISYLIGLVLNLEWFTVYTYYYRKKIPLVLLNIFIVLSGVALLFLLFWLINSDIDFIYTLLKQISFLSFVISFITPGSNLVKFCKSFDAKYIFLYDAITGVLVTIGTFLYEIGLCKYEILGWGNIGYVIVGFAICTLQIIYFAIKYKGNNSKNSDDLLDGDDDDDNVEDPNTKKIGLVSYNSDRPSE